MAGLNPDAKEWKPLNPGAPVWKPPFPDQPPQASQGLATQWDWEGMAKRGTNPVTNVPNPYSTTAVVKGKGKGKRKTRKAKKSKKRKTRRKMRK
jgi:hypothetical protein